MTWILKISLLSPCRVIFWLPNITVSVTTGVARDKFLTEILVFHYVSFAALVIFRHATLFAKAFFATR